MIVIRNLGIRLKKTDTSDVLKLLEANDILEIKLKLKKELEHVIIPLKNGINNEIIKNLMGTREHEIINDEFELKKINEKSIREILLNTLPNRYHQFIPTAFDQMGSIAVIDIQDEIAHFKSNISSAILKLNPSIKSVYRKSSKVSGPYRIRGLELIGGIDEPVTIYKEHGIRFYVDVKKIYYSPRLSTEHSRIAAEVKDNEKILDMFCGLAPFAFHILNRIGADITAIDINPNAKQLIAKTCELNKRLKHQLEVIIADAKEVAEKMIKQGIKYDRIIMNHPSGSSNYLKFAEKLLGDTGVIHFYTFAPVKDYQRYSEEIIALNSNELKLKKIHKVRQSSPSEFHLCIDLIRT